MRNSVLRFHRLAALFALLAAIAFAAAPAFAQKEGRSGHAEATLLLERTAVTPGDTFVGGLRLKLAKGWHVYWRNAGDSGLAPTAEWKSSPAVSAGEFRFQTPHAIPLEPLMNYGYEDEVIFLFDVAVAPDARPGEPVTIGARFDYLICEDTCIPEDVTLSVTLPVAASPSANDQDGAALAAVLPSIPVDITGRATVSREGKILKVAVADPSLAKAVVGAKDIRWFPNGPEILHAARQVVRTGPDGVSFELEASDFAKPGDAPIGGVVAVEGQDGKLRGWEVDAQPGPAPEGVSATVFSGGAPAASAMGVGELIATLGFAFLGGLILNLMPCVLPVLTIKAASLVHTAHDPKVSRAHGIAYLGGVLACFAALAGVLLALKAAGDASAGLGFQLQYAWVVAFFALVMFAVGLNLLGVFEIGGSLAGIGGSLAERGGVSGAFFTGLLAAFVGAPCVGPFMAPAVGAALTQPAPVVLAVFLVLGVGMAAPFVILSFTPAFARILPKPGRWMVTFKQALAFPMFLTVLWLLWVIDGQAGIDGVLIVVAGAIAVAFAIWLATKIGRGPVGRAIAAVLILAAFIAPSVATSLPKAPVEIATATSWSPAKVADLRSEGRVIFVDFTARWCVTCQFNKQAINDPAVQRAFKDLNVAFLEADWTNKDSVIAAALAEHGRAGVPLYLVYPADGGPPAVLDQILTAGMIEQAVRAAAGSV